MILQQGSSGAAVRELQHLLDLAGRRPPLVEDGDFGPATDAAVRWFQRLHGLVVDGIAGPATLAALHGAGEGIRARIVALCQVAIAHEPAIHYTTGARRMSWVRAQHAGATTLTFPAYEDCSSAITGIFDLAGAPGSGRSAGSRRGWCR